MKIYWLMENQLYLLHVTDFKIETEFQEVMGADIPLTYLEQLMFECYVKNWMKMTLLERDRYIEIVIEYSESLLLKYNLHIKEVRLFQNRNDFYNIDRIPHIYPIKLRLNTIILNMGCYNCAKCIEVMLKQKDAIIPIINTEIIL